MKITENTIDFESDDGFDAYQIQHSIDNDGEHYITINDPYDDYVILSSEQAVRNCIEALEESLRFGWVK